MKLTYPVCCGVDVHKTFLVATIIKTDGLVPKYYKKRFSTFSRDLLAFRQSLFFAVLDVFTLDLLVQNIHHHVQFFFCNFK